MGVTSIEWTDESINPFRARLAGSGKTRGGYDSGVGHYCEKVSPGCKNCYSSATQPRFGLPLFQEQRRAGIEPFLDVSKLEEVLRRKKPTKFFWCDMTDMFGEWVPNEWIAACFGVMAATPHHTHQILTKRPKRMREWFEWVSQAPTGLLTLTRSPPFTCGMEATKILGDFSLGDHPLTWPLPNVWLGTSVEDQQRADERIPELLATPAAVRFISAEPLLGQVRLDRPLLVCAHWKSEDDIGHAPWEPEDVSKLWWERQALRGVGQRMLDWVIIGSESGSSARPMQTAWARLLVEQCRAARCAVFTKQIATPGYGKGGDPAFWPPGDWPRDFPKTEAP